MPEDWQARHRRMAREQKQKFEAEQRRSQERQAEDRRRRERDDDKRRQNQVEKNRHEDAARALREAERHNHVMEEIRKQELSRHSFEADDNSAPAIGTQQERRFSETRVRRYEERKRSRLAKFILAMIVAATFSLIWPTAKALIADLINIYSEKPASTFTKTPKDKAIGEEDAGLSKPISREKHRTSYPPCSATIVDHCKETN